MKSLKKVFKLRLSFSDKNGEKKKGRSSKAKKSRGLESPAPTPNESDPSSRQPSEDGPRPQGLVHPYPPAADQHSNLHLNSNLKGAAGAISTSPTQTPRPTTGSAPPTPKLRVMPDGTASKSPRGHDDVALPVATPRSNSNLSTRVNDPMEISLNDVQDRRRLMASEQPITLVPSHTQNDPIRIAASPNLLVTAAGDPTELDSKSPSRSTSNSSSTTDPLALHSAGSLAAGAAEPLATPRTPRKAVAPRQTGAPPQPVTPRQTGAPPQPVTPRQTGAPPQPVSPRQTGAPPQPVTPRQTGAPPQPVTPRQTGSSERPTPRQPPGASSQAATAPQPPSPSRAPPSPRLAPASPRQPVSQPVTSPRQPDSNRLAVPEASSAPAPQPKRLKAQVKAHSLSVDAMDVRSGPNGPLQASDGRPHSPNGSTTNDFDSEMSVSRPHSEAQSEVNSDEEDEPLDDREAELRAIRNVLGHSSGGGVRIVEDPFKLNYAKLYGLPDAEVVPGPGSGGSERQRQQRQQQHEHPSGDPLFLGRHSEEKGPSQLEKYLMPGLRPQAAPAVPPPRYDMPTGNSQSWWKARVTNARTSQSTSSAGTPQVSPYRTGQSGGPSALPPVLSIAPPTEPSYPSVRSPTPSHHTDGEGITVEVSTTTDSSSSNDNQRRRWGKLWGRSITPPEISISSTYESFERPRRKNKMLFPDGSRIHVPDAQYEPKAFSLFREEMTLRLKAQTDSLRRRNQELRKANGMGLAPPNRGDRPSGSRSGAASEDEISPSTSRGTTPNGSFGVRRPKPILLKMLGNLLKDVAKLQEENDKLKSVLMNTDGPKAVFVATINREEQYDRLVTRQAQIMTEFDTISATDPKRCALQKELDDIERTIDTSFLDVQEARERAIRLQEHRGVLAECEGAYRQYSGWITAEYVANSPLMVLMLYPQLVLTRPVVDTRGLTDMHGLCGLEELQALYFSLSSELDRRGIQVEGAPGNPQVQFARTLICDWRRLIGERKKKGDPRTEQSMQQIFSSKQFSILSSRYSKMVQEGISPSIGFNQEAGATFNYVEVSAVVEQQGWNALSYEQLVEIEQARGHTAVKAPSLEALVRFQKMAIAQMAYRKVYSASGWLHDPWDTSLEHLKQAYESFGHSVVAFSDEQLRAIVCGEVFLSTQILMQCTNEMKIRMKVRAAAAAPSDASALEAELGQMINQGNAQLNTDPLSPEVLGAILDDPEGGQLSHAEAAAKMSSAQLEHVIKGEYGCVANIPNSIGHAMLQKACQKELKARASPGHARHGT